MITWHTEKRLLRDLIEWDKNPRQLSEHNAEHIKKSLEKFGIADPLIINTDNLIIGGHQRKKILQELVRVDPDYKIDVRVPDHKLTDDEVAELNIRLNKNSGEWDWDILANQFEVDDLLEWGFTKQELSMLDFEFPLECPDAKMDEAELLQGKWKTELGQTWKLGDHLLVCGDCTSAEIINKLFGNEKARMIFTDPPWNVAIGKDSNPRHRQRDGLQNDDMSDKDYSSFVSSFVSSCDGDVYCVLASEYLDILAQEMRRQDFHWSAYIIWVKDVFVLGRSKYHRRYEPIWYGWNKKNKSSFCVKRNLDDVWEIPRPRRSDEHPTMKPVELVEKAIKNSSIVGDVVADLFLGSGTTLVACEKLGRKCKAIELSPAYVAVSIERWAEMTGKTPELMNA